MGKHMAKRKFKSKSEERRVTAQREAEETRKPVSGKEEAPADKKPEGAVWHGIFSYGQKTTIERMRDMRNLMLKGYRVEMGFALFLGIMWVVQIFFAWLTNGWGLLIGVAGLTFATTKIMSAKTLAASNGWNVVIGAFEEIENRNRIKKEVESENAVKPVVAVREAIGALKREASAPPREPAPVAKAEKPETPRGGGKNRE